MLAQQTATDLAGHHSDPATDRSMLVLQYVMAAIAAVAALLLAGVS